MWALFGWNSYTITANGKANDVFGREFTVTNLTKTRQKVRLEMISRYFERTSVDVEVMLALVVIDLTCMRSWVQAKRRMCTFPT